MSEEKEKKHKKKGALGMAKRALSFSKSKKGSKDAQGQPALDLTEFADLMEDGRLFERL